MQGARHLGVAHPRSYIYEAEVNHVKTLIRVKGYSIDDALSTLARRHKKTFQAKFKRYAGVSLEEFAGWKTRKAG